MGKKQQLKKQLFMTNMSWKERHNYKKALKRQSRGCLGQSIIIVATTIIGGIAATLTALINWL